MSSRVTEIAGRASAGILGYIHGNIPGAIAADHFYGEAKKLKEEVKRRLSVDESFPNKKQKQMVMVKGKTRTVRKSTAKKYMAKSSISLKKAILSNRPAKHYNTQHVVALKHNIIYTNIPTQGINQGTGNTQRVGDKIYLEAIKIRGSYFTPTVANAYIFRIMVLWTGEEKESANLATQLKEAQLGATEIFLPNTYGSNVTTGLVNSKACQVLFDRTYDVNSLVSGVEDVISLHEVIPLKTAFAYQSAAGIHGKLKNLAVCVISSVSAGTANTTATGNFDYACDLIFKD